MAKKTEKKVVNKKPMAKKSVPKKPVKKPIAKKVVSKETTDQIKELKNKIGTIQLKANDIKKGNANDKAVAALLEAKVEKYWGKQKSDLENE